MGTLNRPYIIKGDIMSKLIRFSAGQKNDIREAMNKQDGKAVTLNGTLKMSNASLPKFIAGLDTKEPLFQAYEIYKSFTTQVKDLKGYDKLIKINKLHKEYIANNQDLEKNVKIYLGKLLDSSQKSNLAGKLFTFQGILCGVSDKKITLKLVQQIFLGKQLIQNNELVTISTTMDFITEDDLSKVYGITEKYSNLFKDLCSQINLDRKDFDKFEDFINNYKPEIDAQDKAYHDYMQSIIDDYLEF